MLKPGTVPPQATHQLGAVFASSNSMYCENFQLCQGLSRLWELSSWCLLSRWPSPGGWTSPSAWTGRTSVLSSDFTLWGETSSTSRWWKTTWTEMSLTLWPEMFKTPPWLKALLLKDGQRTPFPKQIFSKPTLRRKSIPLTTTTNSPTAIMWSTWFEQIKTRLSYQVKVL